MTTHTQARTYFLTQTPCYQIDTDTDTDIDTDTRTQTQTPPTHPPTHPNTYTHSLLQTQHARAW